MSFDIKLLGRGPNPSSEGTFKGNEERFLHSTGGIIGLTKTPQIKLPFVRRSCALVYNQVQLRLSYLVNVNLKIVKSTLNFLRSFNSI